MKQSPKPFLPSKKELIGCVLLFLGVLAIILAISFADVLTELTPTVPAVLTIYFLLLSWFYHKRERQRPQKQQPRISTSDSQETESDEALQLFPIDKKTKMKASKMKKLTGILIVTFIVLFVVFVPLKEVAYTATKPLSYQETGFVKKEELAIDALDPRYNSAIISFATNAAEVRKALKINFSPRGEQLLVPTAYVGVVNRDTVSGTFTVHFTFYSSGRQYSKDVIFQLKPNELGEAKYQAISIDANKAIYIDANKDEWSWEYEVTPDTRMVTKYKKVTLFDYLLHY